MTYGWIFIHVSMIVYCVIMAYESYYEDEK